MGDDCTLCAVASASTCTRRLARAGFVSCQAFAWARAVAVHLAVHDATGSGRHDVAGDPRSVAWRRQLHPAINGLAAIRLARFAIAGDPDDRARRHLAVDALRRADRARRTAVPAAKRLRSGAD